MLAYLVQIKYKDNVNCRSYITVRLFFSINDQLPLLQIIDKRPRKQLSQFSFSYSEFRLWSELHIATYKIVSSVISFK